MRIIACITLCFTLCFSEEKLLNPWYTGSLIALSGRVLPVNRTSVQPYIFVTTNYGIYQDNYSFQSVPDLVEINPLLLIRVGLTKYVDFQVLLQSFSNFSQGVSSSHIGDCGALLGFQLLFAKPNTYIPDVRFTITEIFPTGKFQNLNPEKKGTDITGEGTYQTQFGLLVQKIFYPSPLHPTRVRLNLFYTKSSKVSAKNFHFFGGDNDVIDTIAPGDQIEVIIAPEISLTKNWVLASDFIYESTFPTPINRKNPSTAPAPDFPSAVRLSMSPSIEYNFSEHLGIIGGVWFSIFGRNTEAFYSPTLSMAYDF